MKTFTVQIDRKTIRPNPNAGMPVRLMNVESIGQFTVEDDFNLEFMDSRIALVSRATSIDRNEGFHATFSYAVQGMSFDELSMLANAVRRAFPKKTTFRIDNTIHALSHIAMPVPYLYEYKERIVQCQFCARKFSHTELINEYDYDFGGNQVEIVNACPRCEVGNCCDVNYESIESVMLQQAGLPRMAYIVG